MPSKIVTIPAVILFVCIVAWGCGSQPDSDSSTIYDLALVDLPDVPADAMSPDLSDTVIYDISTDLLDLPPDICAPDCEGKQCGTDGCGGECEWTCGLRDTCDTDFKCNPCVPDCKDKFCGDDGCSGYCGQCAPGQECVNFNCPDS